MTTTNSFTRREFIRVTAAATLAGLARPAATVAVEPPDYQLGCYTRPWDQHDYRVALDGIAEAGYRYAGIMTHKGKSWVVITVETTPEEAALVGQEVKKRGLKTLSVYGGDFPVAKSIEAGIAGLKRLVDNCAACECPHLLLGGTTNPGLFEPYYKVVSECCDYAASKHVGLSIKPHGGQNATGPQCRKIIKQVGHNNFRLWYDPGNIFYYSDGKLDPVDDASTVDGLVVGMSVKDFLPPKEVLVTPGTGRVNFREVFSRLKRGGFTRGPLVVECLTRGDVKQITAEARTTRTFLEGLVGRKG